MRRTSPKSDLSGERQSADTMCINQDWLVEHRNGLQGPQEKDRGGDRDRMEPGPPVGA